MRFKQFLSESDDFGFDEEQFKKDCAYYFEQARADWGKVIPIYHGSNNHPENFEIRKFKPRVRPTDSSRELHKAVNEFYTEKFGFPFRNGIFTTRIATDARGFGSLNIFVPVGKFEWLCSKDITDLTGLYQKTEVALMDKDPELRKKPNEREVATLAATLDKVKNASYYHNTNLIDSIWSENEIMIKCDSFYLFYENSPMIHQVTKLLNDL